MITHFWSSTMFTYECLIDVERVRAFELAIELSVHPGDVVVDVGAGSGILSLLAARAGARRVYSVELDPILAASLRATVAVNDLDEVIEVIEGDATEVELPADVDVVVAELIDTWLLDEAQVPVMNSLRRRGVIGPDTRVVPERYEAFLEFVRWDNHFYGFEVAHPRHSWPHYERDSRWWHNLVAPISARVPVFAADFGATVPVELDVELEVALSGQAANAVLLGGQITLVDGLVLEMTPTLNGPKVLLLEPGWGVSLNESSATRRLAVTGSLGGGLGSFALAEVAGP